jgi:hypothetical protein
VPKQRRAPAALGPRVLKTGRRAGRRRIPVSCGPRLHRAGARRIGPDALLAVEHKIAFGDPISTRAAGREAIQGWAWRITGQPDPVFGEHDLADRGSNAPVDALVAQGDAATAAKQLHTQLDAGAHN